MSHLPVPQDQMLHLDREVRRIHATRAGFALIELLVVIAIIVILAAILLPMLGKSKTRARSAKCKSNQRQVAVAMAMYADTHDQWTMPVIHSRPAYWMHLLAPYLSEQSATSNRNHAMARLAVYRCPEAALRPGRSWGDARTCWSYRPRNGEVFGAIGLNLWLLPQGAFANDGRLGRIFGSAIFHAETWWTIRTIHRSPRTARGWEHGRAAWIACRVTCFAARTSTRTDGSWGALASPAIMAQ